MGPASPGVCQGWRSRPVRVWGRPGGASERSSASLVLRASETTPGGADARLRSVSKIKGRTREISRSLLALRAAFPYASATRAAPDGEPPVAVISTMLVLGLACTETAACTASGLLT